jgi:hypothetical protein
MKIVKNMLILLKMQNESLLLVSDCNSPGPIGFVRKGIKLLPTSDFYHAVARLCSGVVAVVHE